MRQKTLFEAMTISLEENGRVKSQSTNPFAVKAKGDIGDLSESLKVLEMQLDKYYPHIEHELIITKPRLEKYLEAIKKNKVVALDTETNPVANVPDPRKDPIAGFSIYTPGESAAYIPIAHDFYEHNQDARWFFRELEKIQEEVAIIMHNSNYDIPVIDRYSQAFLKVKVDTMIASRVLNENERQDTITGSGHGLKYLWDVYVRQGKWHGSTYDALFNSRKYGTFPPKQVFKYATLDALMTYELMDFQMKYLSTVSPIVKKTPDLQSVAQYFWEIEMPVLHIAQEMSRRGINYDIEGNRALQVKYEDAIRKVKVDLDKVIREVIDNNQHKIPKDAKLSSPVNVNASGQLAVLLYDALEMEISPSMAKAQEQKARASKAKSVNYRPTGGAVLEYFATAYPEHDNFMRHLIEYKGLYKIYNTFILKYRDYIDDRTGNIHAEWNISGADTGRMSCKNPNLQQLPSRNQDIRPLFIPAPGNSFMASDFSAQEPRIFTSITKDPILVQNYLDGKDLYATLSATARGLTYEECTKEGFAKSMDAWRAGGEQGPRPINYRDQGKTLLLAMTYGYGAASLAGELKISEEEAKVLLEDFKREFSVAFDYERDLKNYVRKTGFLKTIWGNKRRFPNYALPEIEVETIDGTPLPLNVFNDINYQMSRIWKYYERNDKKEQLQLKYHVKITDNKMLRGDDETRILNSMIQGSAAGMIKKALIYVNNDAQLKEWGAFPVLIIHDELIVEGPTVNADKISKRLTELMLIAAHENTSGIPFESSAEVMDRWLTED